MKPIQHWLDEYGESHQNKTNKIIHWICIPLILWSLIALLSLIPHSYLNIFNNLVLNEFTHWGSVIVFFGLLFYLRLSLNIFIGMLFISLYILIDIYYTVYLFDLHGFWGLFNQENGDGHTFLLYSSIIVFIFAWILQFIGHKRRTKRL